MIVSHWPAILIGKAEFCTCHKGKMKGHKKANQKNIKGNARLKNCLSPLKSTQKKKKQTV
jgi:hypothetical protein